MGPTALLPFEEGVLRIFIALKIHRLRLGLNLRNLGPMASMIMILKKTTILIRT
jgi:hypothetical protein